METWRCGGLSATQATQSRLLEAPVYDRSQHPQATVDVAGIGNALVDALVVMDERALLTSHGLARGHMTLVDHERWQAIFREVQPHGTEIQSGGSGANTIAALGFLGAKATFCGHVGEDQFGHLYASRLKEACGDHDLRWTRGANTGKCLSIISSHDAERTMLTDLGAAVQMPALGAFDDTLRTSRMLHVEGYLLHPGPMAERAREAIAIAVQQQIPVSLDAADPSVVASQRGPLWELIEEMCDVVFLNEEEACTLCESDVATALDRLGEAVRTVVVKLGRRGSVVRHEGETYEVGVHPVTARDTTGAGDAYAAGFLYGYIHGWDPARAADLGARVASLTVGQVGAVVRDRAAMQAALAAVTG